MFGIDKLKLILDIRDVEIVNEEAFIKKVQDDELVEMSFKQTTPFQFTLRIDYRKPEAVIEFSGKVLLSEYHSLIRLSNIQNCLDNINRIGICRIETDAILNAQVVKCDVSNDFPVSDVKGLSIFLKGHLSSHRKYVARELANGNFIVEKNVTTQQCKKRLTIYDKGKEMSRVENQKFLEGYYSGINPFVGMARFELNLNSQAQIRSSLCVGEPTLMTILLSARKVNPIHDFLSEIIDDDIDCKYTPSSIKEYQIMAILKDCDYDIEKVEAKLRSLYSKGTKIRAVLKPYKTTLAKMNDNHNDYTRDSILRLVTTKTHIKPTT